MSNKLTKEQVENYLRKPNECPYCGDSKDITADPPEVNFKDEVYINVECGKCGEMWQEVYTLSTIKEIE